MKTQNKRLLQRAYIVLIFGFMYLPIAVLIAYSFNENKSRTVFSGFTLDWYRSLFHNEMILSAPVSYTHLGGCGPVRVAICPG